MMSPEERDVRLAHAQFIEGRLKSVRVHWADGLTAAESAELLCMSPRSVEYFRRLLGLTRGQAWRGGVEPLGRSVTHTVVVVAKETT